MPCTYNFQFFINSFSHPPTNKIASTAPDLQPNMTETEEEEDEENGRQEESQMEVNIADTALLIVVNN